MGLAPPRWRALTRTSVRHFTCCAVCACVHGVVRAGLVRAGEPDGAPRAEQRAAFWCAPSRVRGLPPAPALGTRRQSVGVYWAGGPRRAGGPRSVVCVRPATLSKGGQWGETCGGRRRWAGGERPGRPGCKEAQHRPVVATADAWSPPVPPHHTVTQLCTTPVGAPFPCFSHPFRLTTVLSQYFHVISALWREARGRHGLP